MSLREAYSLAHTAQCKLRIAADRPDRDLRFLVGHAMHLDSLMVRIIEIEESVDKPAHSSGVSFKGAGSTGSEKKAQASRRSPPPTVADMESESDEEIRDDIDDPEGEDLGLMRFPSAAAAPPRHVEPEPQLIPSDGDSSSEEEDDDPLSASPETLRDVISSNEEGDQFLVELYSDVKKCRCHNSDAPAIERAWELPAQKSGVRTMVAEVSA